MENFRLLKCLNTSWNQYNIVQNTLWYKNFRESNRKKKCGSKYCNATKEVLYEKNIDEYAKCKLNKHTPLLVFRGSTLNFFRSQSALSPKCNTCDTSLKYHIRQGNDLRAKVTQDCPVKDIGTATNYLSFSGDYKICVKYAMTDTASGRAMPAEYGVICSMNTIEDAELNWYCPGFSEKWLEKSNFYGEDIYDKAWKKNGSITQDWVKNDKEILLKISNKTKSLSFDDPRINIVYIHSEPYISNLDTLPDDFKDIIYNHKYKYTNSQLENQDMCLTFHSNLETIYNSHKSASKSRKSESKSESKTRKSASKSASKMRKSASKSASKTRKSMKSITTPFLLKVNKSHNKSTTTKSLFKAHNPFNKFASKSVSKSYSI